jgi:hypothetical protein
VNIAKRYALLGVLAITAATGACNSFLTGGELSNDPNRPVTSTPQARFAGTQPSLWALLSSDLLRVNEVWVQHFEGLSTGAGQYLQIQDYTYDESTTGGFQQGIYTGGGLVDLRELESEGRASGDSLLLGTSQVVEAWMIGTEADLFGDVVYSQALTGTPNPTLDPQLQVYTAVQALLSDAITNMAATGPTNFGPGSTGDINYGGDPDKWTALAHTLKARFYLHTAEVDPTAYQNAYTESQQGIVDPSGDYYAIYSGNVNEQNLWYQFVVVNRADYIRPNPFFVSFIGSDPRLRQYFNADQSELSATRSSPTFSQPLVTAQENLLIWAESAERLGHDGEALIELNASRAISAADCTAEVTSGDADSYESSGGPCVIPPLSGLSGTNLLVAILHEKYIVTFQNLEAMNDYKRTCYPNIAPTVAGKSIPARLYYDVGERQTDTNIPDPNSQPIRNANDPKNTSDPTGAPCLGEQGT